MQYFCVDCGSEVRKQDIYCSKCGNNVELTVEESSTECANCGTEVELNSAHQAVQYTKGLLLPSALQKLTHWAPGNHLSSSKTQRK